MNRKSWLLVSRYPLLVTLMLVAHILVSAQDLNKEVYVVRPYEPTLSDASKYIFMPESEYVETKLPAFKYTVSPKRLDGSFMPELIKPAKTVATSLPKIYKSWIKLGIGNYNTPLAEINISNLRSKEYAFGAYLFHKSSSSNIRLINNDKVPAGYGENKVNLYGKRFFTVAEVSGNLRYNQNGFHYYGYNTELAYDSDSIINENITKQKTYRVGADLGVSSAYTDSAHLNYYLKGHYDYFWDKLKNKENIFRIEAGANKNFNGLQAGIDASVDYSSLRASPDSVNNTIVSIKPWISKRNKDWKFMVGLEAVTDVADITRFYIYPHASLDIIIIENVLVPFINVSGEIQKNTYSELWGENQFVLPGLYLKNASSNLILTAGLKGSITPKIRFRADVTYRTTKDMHFFVNDTTPEVPLQNKFTGVYDDMDLIAYHGELAVDLSSSVRFSLNGSYFDYKVFEQKKPWHKPQFEAGLDLTAKITSKLTLGTGINVIGTRWVSTYPVPVDPQKVKPVADLNLGLNYQYSKAFGLFADLYNIADRSYIIWNQYPSQRFHFMFGLTYKL